MSETLSPPTRPPSAGDTPPAQFHPPPASTDQLPRVPGYELLEELGRGGMGVVYRARQLELDRIVALKMIRSGRFDSPAELARFRGEAELAALLDHPNVVPVYEVGEGDGQPFFSMKYVQGRSLGRALEDPRWEPDVRA